MRVPVSDVTHDELTRLARKRPEVHGTEASRGEVIFSARCEVMPVEILKGTRGDVFHNLAHLNFFLKW